MLTTELGSSSSVEKVLFDAIAILALIQSKQEMRLTALIKSVRSTESFVTLVILKYDPKGGNTNARKASLIILRAAAALVAPTHCC